jgi:hypothetical protein|tara:strand:- start:194 stop:370 length:177 start_codon:yes stop_codon:yes gene_type:complete
MLSYAEIRAILFSLQKHYEEREGTKANMDMEFLSSSKWILRDVNRKVIEKIKRKHGRN